MKANGMSKAQRSSLDIISILPGNIIETILCLLPIKEAARTSIISRDWRYKWTKIPKLVFNSWTVPDRTYGITSASEYANRIRSKLFYVIHQVLLLRQGPIHEFTLYMSHARDCFEIDQLILHLSRNHTVKKLTLDFDDVSLYKLPLCAFSLHELTDLSLGYIDLDHQPIFSGFGSLKTLCLNNVKISTKPLLHLLSNCPSLMRLTLVSSHLNIHSHWLLKLISIL